MLVKIEPAILKYARKYSGFTVEEVSNKTKVAVEKLDDYEDQKCEIPLSHLEKFANVYKRPLAFFLLEKIPVDVVEPKDFRIIYDSEEFSFSPQTYLAIRKARYVQSVISELVVEEFKYTLISASDSDDPEKAADSFRNYLEVDTADQKKWVSSSNALRNWRTALEEKGIFVLQQNLSKEDISAFCLVDKKPYIIVLNSSEHEVRRIFSLFHEIGHIVLHKSGVCTPDDLSRNSYKYVQIEKFCNQFAASLLLPKGDFIVDPDVNRLRSLSINSWSDEYLKNIAQRFKVSREVVVRRFQTLGFINEKAYESWRSEWLKKSEEYKKIKRKGARIPQYLKCLSQNGRGFAAFVLEQYHTNKISFTSAAEILSVNPKHMSQIEAKL